MINTDIYVENAILIAVYQRILGSFQIYVHHNLFISWLPERYKPIELATIF